MNSASAGVVVGGGLVGVGVGVAVIDKYVNQNITNNKLDQYGLTALEGLLMIPTVCSILTSTPQYTSYFNALKDNADLIIATSSIILSALAFKFIWDQHSNATDNIATPELDLVEMDEDSTNTIFDTAAPIDSSDGYQVF